MEGGREGGWEGGGRERREEIVIISRYILAVQLHSLDMAVTATVVNETENFCGLYIVQ